MADDNTWNPWQPPRYIELPLLPTQHEASSSFSRVPVRASMDSRTIVPPQPPSTLGSGRMQPRPRSIRPPFVMNHRRPPAFPPLNYVAPIRPVNTVSHPCNCLYVTGVPANYSEDDVAHIFRRFEGLIRVRFEFRPNMDDPIKLCFVDFEKTAYAEAAMMGLQDHRLRGYSSKYTYLNLRFAHLPAPRNWHPRNRHPRPSSQGWKKL